MNDFSRYSLVTSMIKQLGLPMLKQRRNEASDNDVQDTEQFCTYRP